MLLLTLIPSLGGNEDGRPDGDRISEDAASVVLTDPDVVVDEDCKESVDEAFWRLESSFMMSGSDAEKTIEDGSSSRASRYSTLLLLKDSLEKNKHDFLYVDYENQTNFSPKRKFNQPFGGSN